MFRKATKKDHEVCKLGDLIDDERHGSPNDRGAADAHYGRPFDPHYWGEGTYHGIRTEIKDMTPKQILSYTKGYMNKLEIGGMSELEKWKEENCQCGITQHGEWSEELFDLFGCNCEEEYKPDAKTC